MYTSSQNSRSILYIHKLVHSFRFNPPSPRMKTHPPFRAPPHPFINDNLPGVTIPKHRTYKGISPLRGDSPSRPLPSTDGPIAPPPTGTNRCNRAPFGETTALPITPWAEVGFDAPCQRRHHRWTSALRSSARHDARDAWLPLGKAYHTDGARGVSLGRRSSAYQEGCH